METNGWDEHKRLVMYQLEEHNKKLDKIIDSISNMQGDIIALKLKAAIVGGAAGFVGTGLTTILTHLWH